MLHPEFCWSFYILIPPGEFHKVASKKDFTLKPCSYLGEHLKCVILISLPYGTFSSNLNREQSDRLQRVHSQCAFLASFYHWWHNYTFHTIKSFLHAHDAYALTGRNCVCKTWDKFHIDRFDHRAHDEGAHSSTWMKCIFFDRIYRETYHGVISDK